MGYIGLFFNIYIERGLIQQIVVDINFVETTCHRITRPACKQGSDCTLFLILLLRRFYCCVVTI